MLETGRRSPPTLDSLSYSPASASAPAARGDCSFHANQQSLSGPRRMLPWREKRIPPSRAIGHLPEGRSHDSSKTPERLRYATIPGVAIE